MVGLRRGYADAEGYIRMVKGALPVDIASIADAASLIALTEDVRRTRTPRVLTRDDEAVALLSPLPAAGPRRPRPRQNDALLDLLALAESGDARSTGPTDISSNKHTYLAEATAAEARPAEDA